LARKNKDRILEEGDNGMMEYWNDEMQDYFYIGNFCGLRD
jgi:hypothetical protein